MNVDTDYQSPLIMLTSALFKSASRCLHQMNKITLHKDNGNVRAWPNLNEFPARPEKDGQKNLLTSVKCFGNLRLNFSLTLCMASAAWCFIITFLFAMTLREDFKKIFLKSRAIWNSVFFTLYKRQAPQWGKSIAN